MAQAHECGIRVYGGTLTPFDFDKALANPAKPAYILAQYNGDNIRPNNSGYRALAGAIDLVLFSLR